jgi:hypothetical protein
MANVNTNILSLEGTNLIMLKESHSDSTRKFSETDIIKMLEWVRNSCSTSDIDIRLQNSIHIPRRIEQIY